MDLWNHRKIINKLRTFHEFELLIINRNKLGCSVDHIGERPVVYQNAKLLIGTILSNV